MIFTGDPADYIHIFIKQYSVFTLATVSSRIEL